jgi:ferrochelatase
MRYGNPSLKSGIDSLMTQGCDRILVVPLYPQYSASTSATVVDKVATVLKDMRAQPTVRFAPPYYDDPDYIDALAASIDTHLATLTFEPETIVASFHGMPQSYIAKGDPYQAHCVATVEALRKRMGRDDKSLMLTFQSRFGYQQWLQPYTDKTVERLAKEGVKRLAIVTPGFSADCIETLEEIAQENAEIFRHAGGEQFSAIPCLNDSDPGMDVIRQLVLRELQGWI